VRVALTGGIATGKSYCLERFSKLGVPVIDADLVAREVVSAGSDGLAAIARRFGPTVLQSDGTLDRAALATVVFADAHSRQALEDIVHPLVYQRIEHWFGEHAEAGRLAIADVPLLYETGRQDDFDAVVVVACPPDAQLERLLARGMTPEEAALRLAAQLPIDEKVREADYVIDTSRTREATDRQVIEVWERLRASS
jgi:dephospho-CoA kinase